MVSVIYSAALIGIDAIEIQIEVDCSGGLPGFSLVGLPDSSVRESRERIGAALKNEGYDFINKKTTISMAPADIRKEGSAYDLPLAVGLLVASQQIHLDNSNEWMLMGELSLRGTLRPVKGALSIALMAKEKGYKFLMVPKQNADELVALEGIEIFAVKNLEQVINTLAGSLDFKIEPITDLSLFQKEYFPLNFVDVKGQYAAKRAMEVAAAGAHNFLLVGCPGGGKSMCARRLPSILPQMNLEESLEVTRIHSAAGLLKYSGQLITTRPFRSPHHTISNNSLVGGGRLPKPGEVSLSHHGLLFLDELLEFQKPVLETLRQPIEDGKVTISRTAQTLTFPSQFMLGAAMNPCPCGYLGHESISCRCHPTDIQRYINRLSGPLLDRIDIHIEVPSLSFEEMDSKEAGESSEEIRARVEEARQIQQERFKNIPHLYCNSHMGPDELKKYCDISLSSKELLKTSSEKFGFSARAHNRILKLSRTIADLDASDKIDEAHLAEALQYRCLDRYQQKMN